MSTIKNKLDDFDPDEWGNQKLPGFNDDKLLSPNLNRKLAAKEVTKRTSWKKNNLEAITKPEVSKSKSEKVKKLWKQDQSQRVGNIVNAITSKWEDPTYIQTQKLGRDERYAHPERCGNYKGPVIGTCKKTGKQISCIGIQQIKEAGFEPGNVYACIAGTRKSTGGYTWSRK